MLSPGSPAPCLPACLYHLPTHPPTCFTAPLTQAHGWLMAVSWGLLIPCSILLAHTAKGWGKWWFHLHR